MNTSEGHNPLRLSRDEMRELGYRMVDMLVDRFDNVRDLPAIKVGDRRQLEAVLREPMPEHAGSVDAALELLQAHVLNNSVTLAHPRFFAFISSPNNFVSVMADALVAGFNPFSGTWLGSSGPSQLELVTVDWLREMCRLPEQAGGLFVSGGSMANLTGLAVARHVKLGEDLDTAVAYLTDQAHASVERALRVLGLRGDQIRIVPADKEFRLDVKALGEAMDADRNRGLRPWCVVASAGTTNVGAVDPMVEVADLCRVHDAWFHVDGAYGAAAMMCRRGRTALAGMERADSLSLDPHKWMFQPYEIGCVLVRDRELLRNTFEMKPDYMKDVHQLDGINFSDHGVQLTRSFRALKLWLSLKVFGAAAFRTAIDHGFDLAEHAERVLSSSKLWEVITPAQMAIVAFRYANSARSANDLDRINDAIVNELIADGFAMLSATRLDGRTALRMCTINPETTTADVDDTIAKLESIAGRL